MQDWKKEKEARLREFFGLSSDLELTSRGHVWLTPAPQVEEHVARFNLEWYIIPSAESVPFDETYIDLLYPGRPGDFAEPTAQGLSYKQALINGHRAHQGRIIAVETTQKPRFLPRNRQYYGTPYGYDTSADPFETYFGHSGFLSRSRFGHDYLSLRKLIDYINQDWRRQELMPKDYRLTICPPAVFNLVGTLFHPEWSETETLELGIYRDEHRSVKCYEVGSNRPGDFSYIHEIEAEGEWELLGFRLALVPA